MPDGSLSREPSLFQIRRVSPNYLPTVGIPLLSGRQFDGHVDGASPPVAIVSRRLADRLWPGESAMGKRIFRVVPGSKVPGLLTVVGVAGSVMDEGAKFLVVVNAGSNDISSFAVDGGSLTLVNRVSSGGTRPVSVAVSKDYVYALNLLSNTIGVLAIGNDGSLTAIPGLTKALPAGASGAAEVRVSPNGQLLVVSERVSNRLDTFTIGNDGSLGDGVTTPAAGTTPFGFDFTTRGQVVVSEAGSGSASSYNVNGDGSLAVASAAAATLQRAPCWLIVNNSGRFAYTANAGSATITGFEIAANGTLSRLTTTGVSGDLGAGAQPLDLDMTRNGNFLYVMKNGTGTVGGFAVAGDGGLTPLADTPGLVARAGYMGLAAY
jgi:6-phosphogluconolactonase